MYHKYLSYIKRYQPTPSIRRLATDYRTDRMVTREARRMSQLHIPLVGESGRHGHAAPPMQIMQLLRTVALRKRAEK